MRRVATGDRRSFEELYDSLSGILFSTALRILDDQEAAEDVLQEAFIQIWEKAPLYNPSLGRPLTWALTLTRNKAIDRLRATTRRTQLKEAVQRESEGRDQFDDRSSFETVATEEAAKLVRSSIHALSEDQRQVIELAFYSSLSQSEIAEHLDLPLGTIKSRMRRGMLKLRELLDPVLPGGVARF